MDSVKLGKITAPVGIKGEVRVYPYTDEPTRFSSIEKLNVDGVMIDIENVRYLKNMVILKLSGVDSRNDAELMRGKELTISADKLWEIPEDTYFIKDLLGCGVLSEDGELIGKLSDVIQTKAQDLYKITKEDGRTFLIPAVKEFVRKVDIQEKKIVVRLLEGLEDL
ncbi:MAG: 16S rRNA processing protein RimM [Clostridia bacterium]|nr:16S rRNA processing protein RimM [Clostridia bacterium]